ncbi:hypothetical protein [Streptomyces xanthophaeus]|uniref:hypothetical protein n=1 Tax=Streptomyces xanthophaeus TaxID=67385 RepID=UPI00233F6528|nr:hypothetical protein [Streptomyces xanthophaeus]
MKLRPAGLSPAFLSLADPAGAQDQAMTETAPNRSRNRAWEPVGTNPVRDEVTVSSVGARSGFGEHTGSPAGLSPAVREAAEAIVLAVGAGDDVLIGRLLRRFTQVADFEALIHLRNRLHATPLSRSGDVGLGGSVQLT